MKSMSTIESICAFIAFLLVAFVITCGLLGARVNRTPSHPIGIYWLKNVEPAVGLYAQFCIPKTRDQLPPLDPRVAPCTADQSGTPLLKKIVQINVMKDEYSVQGDHPASLDSRVFGPLQRSDITGVLVPYWTFKHDYNQQK